jgi:hypothetical protein
MISEMLEKLQHSTSLISESRSYTGRLRAIVQYLWILLETSFGAEYVNNPFYRFVALPK